MSKVMQSGERPVSKAIDVWRTVEVQEGISLGWQIVVFVASLIAVFSRLPGALLHAQFFAEDGWVWYQQAYNLQWFRPLGITQAGYLIFAAAVGGRRDIAFSYAVGPADHEHCRRGGPGSARYGAAF